MVFLGAAACTPTTPPRSDPLPPEEAVQWVTNATRADLDPATPYRYAVQPLSVDLAERTRGWLWRAGCPVRWENLRILTALYRGFDGMAHEGRLLVNRDSAEPMGRAFGRLYEGGFQIEQMDFMITLASVQYPWLSTNNTYSFDCRMTIGGGRFSEHAYGHAVDINPVQNPYHVPRTGYVFPPDGAPYLDRLRAQPGTIQMNGLVETAFFEVGWTWGGRWKSARDWMHFSLSGR